MIRLKNDIFLIKFLKKDMLMLENENTKNYEEAFSSGCLL